MIKQIERIMKKLFEDSNQWHNNHFYLCESEEEYNAKLAEARETERNSKFPNPWHKGGTLIGKPVNEGIFTCSPSTLVMDGFASYGGRKFEAEGFSQTLQVGWMYNGCTIANIYIKPNGIIKNEMVETKEWWVS